MNKASHKWIPPTRLTPPPRSVSLFSLSLYTFCLHRNKRIRVIRLWRLLPHGSVSTISNLAPHMSSSSALSPRQPPPHPSPPPRSHPLPLLPPPPPLLLHPPHHHRRPLLRQLTTARTALPWSFRHLASVSSRFTPLPPSPPHFHSFLFVPSSQLCQPDWDRGFM